MLNNVVLVGRLAHEPEFKDTGTHKITKFVIAVTSRGNEKTEFIRITVFDKLAEQVYKFSGKGQMVALEARLSNNDKGLDVIANNVQFLTFKKD